MRRHYLFATILGLTALLLPAGLSFAEEAGFIRISDESDSGIPEAIPHVDAEPVATPESLPTGPRAARPVARSAQQGEVRGVRQWRAGGYASPSAVYSNEGPVCVDCEHGHSAYVKVITPHNVLGVLHHEPDPEDYADEWAHGRDCDCDQCHDRFWRWWEEQWLMFYARNNYTAEGLRNLAHYPFRYRRPLPCKCGYFIPSGCHGHGCSPVGYYGMVYPLNPYYVDQRDTNVYAAQGYGVPMSVPLAPVVRDTYNYGWGVPSSRLTPVSRTVP